MPLIHRLPSSTVKLISSSQTITSVSSVVKELLENAIDAGAGNVEIKLDNNGQDGIEVRDNGCGVKKPDVSSMCQPNCTSKIQEFHDLEQLESYGFRGEALNAICRISDVCITTRTNEDDLAMVYAMDHNGNIVSSKPSALGTGTTVTVTRLFHNLPVRKQYLSTGKRAKEELKRTEAVIKSLALINPSLRVTFCHNKCLIWQKQSVAKLRDSLMQVIGHALVNKLEELSCTKDEVNITLFVPKKNCDSLDSLCQFHIECMMIYVNKRPVRYKKLEKVVLRCISEGFNGQLTARKYPTCLVSVVTSPSDLDVNLEPNKTKVLLKDEEEVLQMIENMLVTYYGIKLDIPKLKQANENNLDSTDSDLNDSSISLQENEKEHESLKVKSKPLVTPIQNNVFKRPEVTEHCELEGEIVSKRLKLDLEAAAESNKDSSSINRKEDASVHVPFVSTLDNNSVSEGRSDPDSENLLRNVDVQEGTYRKNVENLERIQNSDHSLEVPSLGTSSCHKLKVGANPSETTSLSALGSVSNGRSPINDSVVERVMNGGMNFQNMGMLRVGDRSVEIPPLLSSEGMSDGKPPVRDSIIGNVVNGTVNFQKLNMSRDGDTSVESTSLSALGSLSSGRSPISDSVVERVTKREINFQNLTSLRNGDRSLETTSLSASESMNTGNSPVADNDLENVNRAATLQMLSMPQNDHALGSSSSSKAPVNDSIIKNVVNKVAEFQNLNSLRDVSEPLGLSLLENTGNGKSLCGDHESMVKTTTELQDAVISNNNQNVLDTTQFVGTIKQNEINELLTLSNADIAKELGTEFHTDENAKDETSLVSISENVQERDTRQGTEEVMHNGNLWTREDDIPGNKISNAVQHEDGVNSLLMAQEASPPLGDNASQYWTRGQLRAPNGNIIQFHKRPEEKSQCAFFYRTEALLKRTEAYRSGRKLYYIVIENVCQGYKKLIGGALLLSKSRGDVQTKTIDTSLQRVSGQMAKKEHKAFVKFSKEERAKVLKENPGIIFTKIAGVLLERWQALSSEEKAHYYEEEKPKSNNLESPAQPDINKLGNKSGVQNETLRAKERWKIGNRKQQEMLVSLEKLREPCEVILSQTEPPEVLVIGYVIPEGPWVYKRNKELGVMRHWGLKETVVYHRMMAEHTVPLQKLDKPILVDESTVGADNMQLLLSLKRNYDVETNAVIVTSDVIQKNGFRVEIKEGLEQTYCLLTDVASTINFYGLDDLKDTLDLLRKKGIGPLEKCRNLRVAGYIRGQAVRIIHQSSSMLDKQAVQELVNYWSANASLLGNECLHRKPFFEKLHDLPGR